MSTYVITYSFAGGPVLTCQKQAKSTRAAMQQLWAQIGQSKHITIHAITRAE